MIITDTMLQKCAPNVAPITMKAIIKTESNNKPLTLALNKGNKLRYQPKSYNQAVAWANYLEKNNYDFDVGIAQINIRNIHKYGYKAYQLLDPCLNIKIAGIILQKNYAQALQKSNSKQSALQKAISAYNTGNYSNGFTNGYVNKVIINASNNNSIRQNKKQTSINLNDGYSNIIE